MVALLREFPSVKADVQPRAVDARAARGVRRRTGQRPASRARTEAGRRSCRTKSAASASSSSSTRIAARMIDPYPRYAELLAKRESHGAGTERSLAGVAQFSVDDIRDLQVWHKLAWIDPFYLERDERVRALVAKGARLHRGRQGDAARRRARAAAAGRPGVSRRRGPRPDRALDVAVLSPDSAAALRHRRIPAHASARRGCRASSFAKPEDAAEQLSILWLNGNYQRARRSTR